MITLSDDEVALLRSLLTALRGIKVREIDKALVILSKSDRGSHPADLVNRSSTAKRSPFELAIALVVPNQTIYAFNN